MILVMEYIKIADYDVYIKLSNATNEPKHNVWGRLFHVLAKASMFMFKVVLTPDI